jgi:phosphatidylinositol-3-phosphatase
MKSRRAVTGRRTVPPDRPRPVTWLLLVAAVATLLVSGPAIALNPGVAGSTGAALPSLHVHAASSFRGICGWVATPPARYRHLIWIVMENRSYSEVVGAPVLATLAARCGLATNYHNLSHPSQPNYIAMTSGLPVSAVPSTDCPQFCPVHGPSIFAQTSWKVYAESMPGTCRRTDARPYVAHHTAAPYFVDLTNCPSNQVPLSSLDVARLPAFSLVVPDVTHDMHERSSSVAAGDAWLGQLLTKILSSPAYTSGSTTVFVTWDEGGFPRRGNNCANNLSDPGCHVATYLISPAIKAGTRSARAFNHYSLLRTTEELLGLPYLGEAARAASMRTAFHF